MGFASRIGKLGKGIGKAGMYAAQGVGASTIFVSELLGKAPAKNIVKNPAMFAGAIGVGAAGGALLADAVGENPKGGAVAMGTAGFALASVGGAGLAVGAGATVAGAAIGGAGVISELGSKMIKMPMKNGKAVKVNIDNLGDISLSGFGKAALGVGLIASGAGKAYKTFEKSRMGANDGMLRTATPIIPQAQQQSNYLDNAGATGDLVFSMYDNR